jgi:hypothetical protein
MNVTGTQLRRFMAAASCLGDDYQRCKLDRVLEGSEFLHFVRRWLEKARGSSDSFESLIYLWVAFDGWLAELAVPVEQIEYDRPLLNATARDADLSERFAKLLKDGEEFGPLAREFHSLWPIFNVRRLAQKHIAPWNPHQESRETYCTKCFDSGLDPKAYEPRCFRRHEPVAEDLGLERVPIPLDWRHTLAAIYQVRCNLFHGGKAFQMDCDQQFARLAFEILWNVWGKAYL